MSKIIQCKNGHYYDAEKFGLCPHCSMNKDNPYRRENKNETLKEQMTVPSWQDDERTVRYSLKESGLSPVTGWLVCVSGKERGKDFRLQAGFNHVGRSTKMDIVLSGDISVSRERHCSVVYDKKSNETFLVPGKGTVTYYKTELVKEPVKIHSGDRIEIGSTEFVFISFCEGERSWE